MNQDGPRRQGRFIKSGSAVMEKVALVDFSFKEINDAKVVTPDNARRNIIHTSYHDEIELREGVNPAAKFNDDLATREHLRPVIFPSDFTKEWERDKKMRKDRVARQDDEDFDYDLEARQKEEEEKAAADAEEAAALAEVRRQLQSPQSPGTRTGEAAERQPEKPSGRTGDAPTEKPQQWQSMDVVGKAIKGMMHVDSPAEIPGSIPVHTPAPQQAPAVAPKSTDDFIPANTTASAQGGAMDPESQAAEDYRQRVEALKANEEKLAELAEEAKAKGYRDGFRMGEEKAELQARQNAAALFGKVSELIGEFAGLKHEVLNNVQENFYELCQAMAESLIKREFSIHPEAFVTVLRRAIDEAVEPGKFKIKVNPETYSRIAGLGASDILDSLVRDPDVQTGDFKIESQMSIVDVSITKMINELLQQADLNLFQEEEKAS